jgi:mono/diheme cytochrome c family protein
MKRTPFCCVAYALAFGAGIFLSAGNLAVADSDSNRLSAGLIIPRMDAVAGRSLFASKGCVVCHSINGVGGEDAPPLDAEYMDTPMNPFEFAARMWRGAEAMVILQREELGDVIELTGEELAAIIAFVHDADEQATFSEQELPEHIADLVSGVEHD